MNNSWPVSVIVNQRHKAASKGRQESELRNDMKWNAGKLHVYLYVASIVLLLGGLGSAVWIYQSSEDTSSNNLGYEIVGGNIYSATPSNTKKYSHDLELYGGKAAVLADRFTRWYSELWHGRSLAFTVACIALLLSAGVFLGARHVEFHGTSGDHRENNRDRTD
jgi:hypothetical protein